MNRLEWDIIEPIFPVENVFGRIYNGAQAIINVEYLRGEMTLDRLVSGSNDTHMRNGILAFTTSVSRMPMTRARCISCVLWFLTKTLSPISVRKRRHAGINELIRLFDDKMVDTYQPFFGVDNFAGVPDRPYPVINHPELMANRFDFPNHCHYQLWLAHE